MNSPEVLYHKWYKQLIDLWPEQHQARLKVLAWLLVGMFMSGHVHLGKIARKLPSKTQKSSQERRLSRLLNNRKLPVRPLYAPIAINLLNTVAKSGQPIRLIIDGSKVGNGHQLLMISVAFRRRSFPIMWTWRKGVKGHSPVHVQVALFLAVRLLIPEGATVIVTGDSEFGSCKLMQRFENWGWFYALRQKGRYVFSEDGGKSWKRCDKVAQQKRSRWFPNITLTQKHSHQCNLLVCWKKGYKDPWLIATNLPTAQKTRLHYSRRMWIEALFGDCKSNGFDIEMTQLQTPIALNRLIFAVALLVVWLLSFGSRIIKAGKRYLVDRKSRRDLSLFRIGWDSVERRLANQQPLSISLFPCT